VLADGVNCNSDPRIIPQIGDISPTFGVWSPDGSRLAFTYKADSRSRSQILVIGAACIEQPDTCIGKILNVVENDYSSSSLPRWSPDGSLLAFQSGDNAIYGTDAQCYDQQDDFCLINTQELVKLAEFAGEDYVWSLDGKHIAMLLRGQIGGYRAWAENTEGWKPDVQYNHTLLTPNNKNVEIVAWLPDGRIIFLDHFQGESSGDRNTTPSPQATILYIAEANNSIPTAVATLAEGSYLPGGHGGGEFALSPDGRYVALSFNGYALEDRDIWLLDLYLPCVEDYATSCTKDDMIRVTGVDSEGNEIANETMDDGTLAWSPDGSLIAFVRSSETNLIDEIEIVNASGRNPAGGDIYVIDFAAALAGNGEDSITPITSNASVNFPFTYNSHGSDSAVWPPQWQPAPDTQP
jgi:dipeptidyl aminopeptidase/acylaminoacyl peptidase